MRCNGVLLMLPISTVVLGPPGRIHSTLHAFLVDQTLWEQMEPDPTLTIGTITISLVITFSTILVKYKLRNKISPTTTTSHRFENPFKNVNFIIIIFSLTYTILQKMFFDFDILPLLMFPRFYVGLYVTPMLGMFLLGNPAIQEHAVKSILSLIPTCLEQWTSQGNIVQIQNGPTNPNNQICPSTVNENIYKTPREMETKFGEDQSKKNKTY